MKKSEAIILHKKLWEKIRQYYQEMLDSRTIPSDPLTYLKYEYAKKTLQRSSVSRLFFLCHYSHDYGCMCNVFRAVNRPTMKTGGCLNGLYAMAIEYSDAIYYNQSEIAIEKIKFMLGRIITIVYAIEHAADADLILAELEERLGTTDANN